MQSIEIPSPDPQSFEETIVSRQASEIIPKIKGLVYALAPPQECHNDFLQEGLAHFFTTVLNRPGMTLSWYLQACKDHMRDLLKRRKSVDSLKRRHTRCTVDTEDDDSGEDDMCLTVFVCHSDPFIEVSCVDEFEAVWTQLYPRDKTIFGLLWEGYGIREIARHLRIRHQSVSKSRRRIALAAARVGIVQTRRLRVR